MNDEFNELPEYLKQQIAAKVTAKAEELILEFREHKEEFIAAHPTLTDEHKIFHGWAIQKVAGLQCQVLDLVERVIALEHRKHRG